MNYERFRQMEKETARWFVSFDFDGVLIDSFTPVTEEFNNRYCRSGRIYGPQDFKGWNTIASWAILEGYSESKALEINQTIWVDPDVLGRAKARPGARFVAKKLIQLGNWTPVITSRNPSLRQVTEETLTREIPEIPIEWLFIRKKSEKEIDGDIFKARTISSWQRVLHFEDSVAQARLILDLVPRARIVLLSPWHELDHRRRIYRVVSRSGNLPDLCDFWRKVAIQPYLNPYKFQRRTMSLTQLFPRYRL